jgi:alpha-mannosidase
MSYNLAPVRPTVHIVPHTHWDREWYHSAARFQLRLARVVDQAMDLLDHGRLPSFLLDGQAVVLGDYAAARPDRVERLGRHLASGALESGPWFVLADNFLVSGEALVRNLLEGSRAVRRYGGKPMRVGYAPDTFGHPAILPTLFSGFGIHNAVTWRGFGGERGQEHDLYRWVGPDGSAVVMIHLPPQGYENGANLPVPPAGASGSGVAGRAIRERWQALRTMFEKRALSPHWLVLNGADHHAPQPDLKAAVRAIASLAPDCDVAIGRLGDYAQAVERWAAQHGEELSVLLGELRQGRRSQWVLQGTHSARLYLKQENARCQRMLERAAEPLAALAGMVGDKERGARGTRPPGSGGRLDELTDDLQLAWRTLLENHPHDSICGTSSDAVHREMMIRFARCQAMADEIAQRALDVVVGCDPDGARVAGRAAWQPALMIFNPSPVTRGGVVVADVALFSADVRVGQQGSAADRLERRELGGLVLRDASGTALAIQQLSEGPGYDRLESPRYYPDCDAVEWRRVAIAIDDLPSLGIATLRVEERGRAPSAAARSPEVGVSEFGLANEHLWVRVESDGTIAAVERSSGRSVHGLGGIECMEDLGDSYTGSPRGRNLTADPDVVAVRVMHAGPLVGELEIVRRFADARIEMIMRVRLDAGARHLELSFAFDNGSGARRVRAAFPLGHSPAAVVADGPFGPVDRPAAPMRKRSRDLEAPDPCAPMQRYVSIAGVKEALTVFADGLPQYEARRDGTLLVTLLRSFTELSKRDLPERPGHAGWPTPTPGAATLGRVRARLAVMIHDPETLDEREPIESVAEAFLSPPIGFMRRWMQSSAGDVAGPELHGDGLVFSAMKPAESGRGIVLRCYNDRSEAVSGFWEVGDGFKSAMKCRLDETKIAALSVIRGRVEFGAEPREIVTILVS